MTELSRGAVYRIVLLCGVLALAAAAPHNLLREPALSSRTPPPVVAGSLAGRSETHLAPPMPGPASLTVITPTLLEVFWVLPEAAVGANAGLFTNLGASKNLPAFSVLSEASPVQVTAVGLRRRAAYAPLKKRDLRIGHSLFLMLSNSVAESKPVELTVANAPWGQAKLSVTVDPQRVNPAIHVNQTGYLPNAIKRAFVGYFLGTLGEADFGWRTSGTSTGPAFKILDQTGKEIFSGSLKPRPDFGFPSAAYQNVWEAEFTPVKTPGTYRVFVPGLGTSYPFQVGDAVAGALARTYALGLYHQRCGMANALPYTRFIHGECHVRPAEVPDNSAAHENCNWTLEQEASDCKENPRHLAKPLTNVTESLYPFVNAGPVDVRGGHHDAGDYSKYTINSAAFIHELVIGCDALPGLTALDNLGLPESGDGKSDVLQEAKWEADFLTKMQDADGGFYFLVYPKGRRYEDNVLPDHGDPQVVFPKTTAATAAAVAALAQCASSPTFREQFPEAAHSYLAKAKKGWAFLTNAIAMHGKDGAYQKITHYGDEFMHDDELAWAAVELFLATGEPEYEMRVFDWFKPNDPELRKWGWMRLFDAHGNAIRSYALAAKTGRLPAARLDPALYEAARQELRSAGDDQLRRARESAYGTSFPSETKRVQSAGWYFALDAAFDLALALQVDGPIIADTEGYYEAVLGNIGYEQGANPLNMNYLTGLGQRRQFEIVHQYAQNDWRMLPPSGIPLGNIQDGISWIDVYKNEPMEFSLPRDDDPLAPYPFYDRWADAFNLSQEFVIRNQARGLAVTGWLMAQTSLRDQAWKPIPGTIQGAAERPRVGRPLRLQLTAVGVDLSNATITWEASGSYPQQGALFDWRPEKTGKTRVEAEALLPDGRRIFAALETTVSR